jgi:hypothetical protein
LNGRGRNGFLGLGTSFGLKIEGETANEGLLALFLRVRIRRQISKV